MILFRSALLRAAAPLGALALTCTVPSLVGCSSDDGPSDPIAVGRSAVTKHDCVSCHEPKDGAGTLAGQTEPQPKSQAYPANLTPDSETGIGDFTDEQLVKAILTGVDDEDAPLCPPMPHFQTLGMDESEAKAIAAYLRSLAPVSHPIPESSCPPLKTAAPEGDGQGDGGQ